ncbi:hypothetical protein [Kitasatospora phosalacinea]|uniref:Uncharacterized protein n=1 Tax=Kitasatospora phosalacinea TaxID=2065 RepID=A0A9W6PNN3_9ACTN|nr:hypothetical protein [Kitasatospora phosalacinea]GLW58178.1 hypothetical protein Kpho01_61890 [Kitasatospora phosalacinea]
MIPSITRYASTRDLLASAQQQARHRPGHPRVRIVAAWRPVAELPRPGTAELDALAADLDADLLRLRPERERRPGRERDVWHCTLRAHPDSPPLTDARWAEAARRVLAATGIAPDGDAPACRWIALRVDSHEVRIIAPLARPDGRRPDLERDLSRAMAVCQLLDIDSRRLAATASAALRARPVRSTPSPTREPAAAPPAHRTR